MPQDEKHLMTRLAAAIKKATAAGTATECISEVTATRTTKDDDSVNNPKRWYIAAKFGSSEYYTIPWAACHNWNVRSFP